MLSKKNKKTARVGKFENYTYFHFIGIGGIGMSALARYLKSKAKKITGSDSATSGIIESLIEEGIDVSVGHAVGNLQAKTECVIYTLAIAPDNPEFLKAKKLGLPIFTYAEVLGQISVGSQTVAVSGTHGKTTTTAMIDSALRAAGIMPNTIVGSLLSESKMNFLPGNSKIFLVEACEYKKSFLNLSPHILVITNIEADHLDYYKDLNSVKSAFMEMADKVPADGAIVCDFGDRNLTEIIAKHGDKLVNFRNFIEKIPRLSVIGEHNVRNAAAALATVDFLIKNKYSATDRLGILAAAEKGLAEFKGTWRRLEFRGQNKNGALIYDDYAHHPTEIRATLSALRQKFPDKKLAVFFQPHLYSRTKTLFDDFVTELSVADELFLLPIYAAREPADPEITSEKLAEKIPGAKFLPNFVAAALEIKTRKQNDIVLTMGAGDVYLILADLRRGEY